MFRFVPISFLFREHSALHRCDYASNVKKHFPRIQAFSRRCPASIRLTFAPD